MTATERPMLVLLQALGGSVVVGCGDCAVVDASGHSFDIAQSVDLRQSCVPERDVRQFGAYHLRAALRTADLFF